MALASAEAFDVDVPLVELLDGVPAEEVAQALAVVLGTVLDVFSRKNLLGTVGVVAAVREVGE